MRGKQSYGTDTRHLTDACVLEMSYALSRYLYLSVNVHVYLYV